MKLKMAEYRKQAGISQRKLAELIGRSFRTVQKWESEETYPQADDLCKLCELFGTDPNNMLGWYEEHPDDISPTLTHDEAVLLNDYRECTPPRRAKAAEAVRDQRDLSKESAEGSPSREGSAA